MTEPIDVRLVYDTYNTHAGTILRGHYWQRFLERGLTVSRDHEFKTNATFDDVTKGFDLSVMHTATRDHQAVFELDECLVMLSTANEGSVYLFLGALDSKTIDKTIVKLAERCPEIPVLDKAYVQITFWMDSQHGPRGIRRNIHVQRWKELEANYPVSARSAISQVMTLIPSHETGKLILWHGEPGTGKTNAIRSLAKEWNAWCEVHYIVDPERFFGEADYLMNVLLNGEEDEAELSSLRQALARHGQKIKTPKWRLLIIEDADEFLVQDAKKRTGQALSRLLNATDGLIGQGLRVLTLITTNEPVTNIHKAVSREGRCLANIEFPRFNRAEAHAWLKKHEIEVLPRQDMSLAELYETVRKSHIKREISVRDLGNYI